LTWSSDEEGNSDPLPSPQVSKRPRVSRGPTVNDPTEHGELLEELTNLQQETQTLTGKPLPKAKDKRTSINKLKELIKQERAILNRLQSEAPRTGDPMPTQATEDGDETDDWL